MQSQKLIQPRTLKGFQDFLPEMAIPRERLIDVAKEVYRSFGYSPIDTPALEYAEILLGKGGDESDKQLYRFEDAGGRDVVMRFDLTVPLARFMAQHASELGTPFKCYHVAPVWRGENTQRGRYREFMQCDFDTIGTESLLADAETALVIHEVLRRIGFERFTIQVNNRKLLSGILERLDLGDRATPVLRALDKLAKIGPEKVAAEMQREAGISEAQAVEVLKVAGITGEPDAILRELEAATQGNATARAGLDGLREVLDAARAGGISPGCMRLDLSVVRGLDYYTGTVFETTLDDLPGIGSVCSGGRYDDLASLYTKERLPGIGASVGLDRLLAAMEELGMLERRATAAPVFIPLFSDAHRSDYVALAMSLRRAGLGVELYPQARKLAAQLKYADRRGFRVAVIVGDTEWEAGTCQVKDLTRGTSEEVALEGVAAALTRLLG